jgi:hypothetical protein
MSLSNTLRTNENEDYFDLLPNDFFFIKKCLVLPPHVKGIYYAKLISLVFFFLPEDIKFLSTDPQTGVISERSNLNLY